MQKPADGLKGKECQEERQPQPDTQLTKLTEILHDLGWTCLKNMKELRPKKNGWDDPW